MFGLAIEPVELCLDLTEGVGDLSRAEAEDVSLGSCFCVCHRRFIASLIVPGFGAPLIVVEADLEVLVLFEGGTLFSATTAGAKVGDLLGLSDAFGLGVLRVL